MQQLSPAQVVPVMVVIICVVITLALIARMLQEIVIVLARSRAANAQ